MALGSGAMRDLQALLSLALLFPTGCVAFGYARHYQPSVEGGNPGSYGKSAYIHPIGLGSLTNAVELLYLTST